MRNINTLASIGLQMALGAGFLAGSKDVNKGTAELPVIDKSTRLEQNLTQEQLVALCAIPNVGISACAELDMMEQEDATHLAELLALCASPVPGIGDAACIELAE